MKRYSLQRFIILVGLTCWSARRRSSAALPPIHLFGRWLGGGFRLFRQAARAFAFADVAHRFVEVAVVAVIRIADHALDDLLVGVRRHLVRVVARVQRGGQLRVQAVNRRARVERRLHLRLILRQRHAAETRGGRERRPGIDDAVCAVSDGLWIARHNISILSSGEVSLIPNTSRR